MRIPTRFILFWSFLATLVGLLSGTASAFFLVSLDWVTACREDHRWLIGLLPLLGAFMGGIYHHFGQSVEGGNNLILDEIHEPRKPIPLRMTPLILAATLLTHLFGGSAGREGTAVQMGGSLADQLTGPFKLSRARRRILLMAGMSAGFASVFGTPLAGALFGLEVLTLGRMRYDAILPCFFAALVGHFTTLAWGVHHSHSVIGLVPSPSVSGFLQAAVAGAVFGWMGWFFSSSTHFLQKISKNWSFFGLPNHYLRPFLGGVGIAFAVYLTGSTRYIGLGLEPITQSFQGKVPIGDFALKSLFTTATLGMGFKGGEVTPLFFIGSTLGNALSNLLTLPLPLLSGMGFVAVFAGAANVPLTCTLMGIELFGSEVALYLAIACVMSFLFSGHSGVYSSQRIEGPKHLEAEL